MQIIAHMINIFILLILIRVCLNLCMFLIEISKIFIFTNNIIRRKKEKVYVSYTARNFAPTGKIIWKLGGYFGNDGDSGEKIDREYKEVRLNKLHACDKLSEHIIERAIRHNLWDPVLEAVEKTIEQYISTYVPKYLTATANSKMNYCDFLIGVADDGEIIGFPLSETLLQNEGAIIHKMVNFQIQRIIETLFCAQDPNYTLNQSKYEALWKELQEKIQIQLIILDSHTELIDDQIDDFLRSHQAKLDIYNRQNDIYQSTRRVVIDQIKVYQRSLSALISDPMIREELIQFILEDITICVPDHVKNNIIEKLKDIDQYVFQTFEGVSDPTSMLYWITKFRDTMVAKYAKLRPRHHMLSKPVSPYGALLYAFRPIIKRMASNGIPMGMIHIRFPGAYMLSANFPKLSYFVGKCFKSSIRTVDSSGQPCCV